MGHGVELFTDTVVGPANVAADIRKSGAGLIGDFLLAENGFGDIVFQRAQGLKPRGHGGDDGRVFPICHQVIPGGAGGAQQIRHQQQRLGGEGGALFRQRQIFAHILKADQRMPAQIGQRGYGFLGFVQSAVHIRQRLFRLQRQAFFLSGAGKGVAGQHLADLVKFQHPQGAFVHENPLLYQYNGFPTGLARNPGQDSKSVHTVFLIWRLSHALQKAPNSSCAGNGRRVLPAQQGGVMGGEGQAFLRRFQGEIQLPGKIARIRKQAG